MHQINVPNSAIFSTKFQRSLHSRILLLLSVETFNVIFDEDLDGSGGIKKTKESVKILEDICLEQDLIDIWRVRNPTEKRFTWRQKTPIIQRRLDYWLVNDSLQDDIVSVDIIPSIKSDHSAITLSINGIDDSKRGPSFWKFNCSLVNDNNYCDLLDTNIKSWLEEFKDVVDKRVLWDLLKIIAKQKLGTGELKLTNWKKNYRTVTISVTMTHRDKMLKI